MDINQLSSGIIGAAIEVHKAIGPGLLESAYDLNQCTRDAGWYCKNRKCIG